jgi:hypothetical protein
MGPPQKNMKRKQIVDYGGEPTRAAPGAMTKKGSMGAPPRCSSGAVPSRHPAVAVRNASLGNSIGLGRRAILPQYGRPQSAMLNPRADHTSSSTNRSTSSLDLHSRGPNESQGMGNMGRISFPSNSSDVYESSMKADSHGCRDPHISCHSDWESIPFTVRNLPDTSLKKALNGLSFGGKTTPKVEMNAPSTPSQIPLRTQSLSAPAEIPSPTRSPKKAPAVKRFLTRDSNTSVVWGSEVHMAHLDTLCTVLTRNIDSATAESVALRDSIVVYKTRGGWK